MVRRRSLLIYTISDSWQAQITSLIGAISPGGITRITWPGSRYGRNEGVIYLSDNRIDQ